MSWSQTFRDELANPRIAPAWQLRTVPMHFNGRPASVVSSHPGLSGIVAIADRGVSISGEAVDPVTWNTTHGGFRVALAGPNLENLWQNFRRGTVVQLYMGFAGWQEADFEPVALGVLQQVVTTSANSWELQISGLGMLLASRMERTADLSSLFYLLPQETTLAADFLDTDTSAVLTDASGFDRETGGSYLLLVTPSTGDPFYVLGTGKSTNTITGITASVAALGTTRVSAVSGDVVESVAYIAGHPCDIARKVLCSTGAGSNGAYDTLPASWGFGLPDVLFDHADIAWTRNAAMAVSSGTWDMVATSSEAQISPGDWLASYLAPAGVFITARQGKLTIRAAQTPYTARVRTGVEIGDWLARGGIVSHAFYDGRYAVEQGSFKVIDSNPTPSQNVTTETPVEVLPAGPGGGQTIAVYGASTMTVRVEVGARTALWSLRVPEIMVVDCSGWWVSQLCPGDIATLTTDRRRGRTTGSASTGSRFRGRQVFISGLAPVLAPNGSYTTRLELLILPEIKG